MGCKVTSFDFHYDKMFAKGIDIQPSGSGKRACVCISKLGGQELVQYVGQCNAEQCLKHYLVVRTDHYVYHDAINLTEGHLWKSESKAGFSIVHNPNLYKEPTFRYECEEKGCLSGNCTLRAKFPSITEGLSTTETKVLVMLIHKDRAGSKLSKIEREAVDRIPLHEQDRMLFEDLGDEPVLVKKLRENYTEITKDEGLELDSVFVASDLLADGQVVELPDFVRFCRQLEAARGKKLSEDSAAELLFGELKGGSGAAGPMQAGQLRSWYDRALATTGLRTEQLLVNEDLVADAQDVDLDSYKRFRKLLRKARGQHWALSDDDADEVAFEGLSDGKPVAMKPMLDKFRHRADKANVDMERLKKEPDLGLRNSNGQDTFKRVARLVRKGNESALTDDVIGEELFKEVGHSLPALRDAYEARLQGLPIDLQSSLREADLVGSTRSVDLPAFKLFRKMLKKAADGDGKLNEDDAADIAFHALSTDGGTLDVPTAAASFKHRLEEGGTDVATFLASSDLDFGRQELDAPAYKRLAKLARKTAAGELSEDSASALLFEGVCPSGTPCKVSQLRQAYEARLAADHIDIGLALKQAFLPSDSQNVDLAAFKRFRKVARKAKEGGADVQEDEAAEVLFHELTDGSPEKLTAGRLRRDFDAHLKHEHVDIQHLFDAAELTSDEKEVSLSHFKRFAKLLHKAQGGSLTEDTAAEVLLADLGRPGPVSVAKLRTEYAAPLKDKGVDVGLLLDEADLAPEGQDVSLDDFKRFRRLSQKAKAEGHDLAEDEVAEVLLEDLSSKAPDAKVTARQVRSEYEARLKDAGLDVGHILSDAGLQDDSKAVDLPVFRKFLKGVKRAKGGAPTETELFLETSPNGSPVTVAKLREVYGAKLKPIGISVDDLITVAGLKDADPVDLPAFQRFLHPRCHSCG